ncbi:MAG TPA: phage holin family protein [Candidatus Rubrimentiphilum sp.]|nr:phage holin family protein [Candidatus Rubrimentiphilum sp.]
MHFIIRLLINAFALWLIAKYVPGFSMTGSIWTPIIAALIFGIVNALVRPIVLLLTLPISILTLGLFVIIVNALMFWLVTWLTPNFKVSGFVPALIGAIIMMVVSLIVNKVFAAEEAPRAAV